MASPEENKAVWLRYVDEVLNKGNIDALDELVDDEVVFHVPELVQGREALKEFVKTTLSTITDLRAEIDELIAEGDKVVALMKGEGSMSGEFMGQDVTGKHVTLQVAHFLRFSGGRIVEDRLISNQMALLAQLGFAPQPV